MSERKTSFEEFDREMRVKEASNAHATREGFKRIFDHLDLLDDTLTKTAQTLANLARASNERFNAQDEVMKTIIGMVKEDCDQDNGEAMPAAEILRILEPFAKIEVVSGRVDIRDLTTDVIIKIKDLERIRSLYIKLGGKL
jgi:hypothetical protein